MIHRIPLMILASVLTTSLAPGQDRSQTRVQDQQSRRLVVGTWQDEKADARLRAVDRLKIEAVWINVYLGGTWTAEQDHHLYLDEIVISKQPIGPLGSDK